VIDVPHDRYDRGTRFKVRFIVLKQFESFLDERAVDISYNDGKAQFLREHEYGILVDVLIYIRHYAEPHEPHNDIRAAHFRLFRESGDGDRNIDQQGSGRERRGGLPFCARLLLQVSGSAPGFQRRFFKRALGVKLFFL
jgi:hypothetical protein